MLILIRHGKAVDVNEWTGAERDRPLTDEGRERTARLARGSRFLVKKLTEPILYASPYARAYETACIFGEEWNLPVVKNTLFEPGWNAEQLPPDYETRDLIIVGHMPDMKEVLYAVTRGQAAIDFQPPSLAAIAFGKNDPRLVAYLTWKAW